MWTGAAAQDALRVQAGQRRAPQVQAPTRHRHIHGARPSKRHLQAPPPEGSTRQSGIRCPHWQPAPKQWNESLSPCNSRCPWPPRATHGAMAPGREYTLICHDGAARLRREPRAAAPAVHRARARAHPESAGVPCDPARGGHAQCQDVDHSLHEEVRRPFLAISVITQPGMRTCSRPCPPTSEFQ